LLLALLSLLALAQPVQAELADVRWYDVEILLFAQTNQDYRNSETWPIDYTVPDVENARELLPLDKASRDPVHPSAFRLLDADELHLSADAERIDKAPDLQLLGHFGWRQPGMPQQSALAIRVDQALLDRANALMPAAAENDSTKDGMPAANKPLIEGTLRLILSRYLHIEADLLLKEPLDEEPMYNDAQQANVLLFNEPAGAPMSSGQGQEPDLFAMAEENAAQAPYRVYFMHQSRRMRSGELHYLDHPVFGMAIKVTPYQPPKVEQSAQAPQ